jgi:hypothetical protein
MALKLKLIQRPVSLKACYEDCKVSDLERIGPRTFENIMQALSDAPSDLIQSLTLDEKTMLMDFFEFLTGHSGLQLFVPKTIIEVGAESFEKVERAKQLFQINPETYFVIPGLCRIYMGDDWVAEHDNKISEVFSQGLQIFDSFKGFIERHRDLADIPDSDKQLAEDLEEVGGDTLAEFGVFRLIYSMCDGKPWKYPKLLNSAAEDVYLTLRYSKSEKIVQARLEELYKLRRTANQTP